MVILLVDVGGINVWFVLVDMQGICVDSIIWFCGDDYLDFDQVVQLFL